MKQIEALPNLGRHPIGVGLESVLIKKLKPFSETLWRLSLAAIRNYEAV